MPTIFDSLSEDFYRAYFEPDTKKRKKTIDKWIKDSAKEIEKEVESDLRSYLEQILETRWTAKGWESGVKKFIRIMDNYKLVMNLQITDTKNMKYTRTVSPVQPKERDKTIQQAEKLLSKMNDAEVAKNIIKKQKSAENQHTEDDGWDDDEARVGSGRSPNDQRSDVMNPNNDEYKAAADNRSNQMNPNNPAYHSSRSGRR